MSSPLTPIREYANRFFDKRAGESNRHSFGLKNTYVFASKQGFLFLVLLVITFIAGVNYANNLVLSLFFYLVSLWLVSAYVSFMQMAALTIELKHISLTEHGDIAWVTLAVSANAKAIRQLTIGFDDDLAGDNPTYQTHKKLLLPKITQTPTLIKLPIIAHQRGKNVLPRLTVSCQFPLGIVVAWGYARFASAAWAYPKPTNFDINANQAVIAIQDHDNAIAQSAGLSDFDRLDSYVVGESLARISWGHLARGMGFLTKHFSDTIGQEQVLDYYAMPASHHESKLSMLSYGVQSFGQSQAPFKLVLPSISTDFGAGDAFVEHCLLLLAKEP